jgi:hypothetical protein
MKTYSIDTECFSNYFLLVAYNHEETLSFELSEGDYGQDRLKEIISFICRPHQRFVSFNGFSYDCVLLAYLLEKGLRCTRTDLHTCSQNIISRSMAHPKVRALAYGKKPFAHIDIFQLLNKKNSLKEWQCRIGFERVLESPVDFEKPLPASKIPQTIEYCINDAKSTYALYEKFQNLVTVRADLIKNPITDIGSDAYVLGDAGIAQQVFTNLSGSKKSYLRSVADESEENTTQEWKLSEIVSPRVAYKSDAMRKWLAAFRNSSLIGDDARTSWKYSDKQFNEPIKIGAVTLQLGIGGLHSIDAPSRLTTHPNKRIIDMDVASYYPSLILNEEIEPEQLRGVFLDNYRQMRDLRVAAKRAGDKATAEVYKIILNASYGVMGNPYSMMRSHKSQLRVVINGQLQLMMLIEALTMDGIEVISANTDGVTVCVHPDNMGRMRDDMHDWQQATGHVLEENEYVKFIRKDVNNYIALDTSGKVKLKGDFHHAPDNGKWEQIIVKQAAQEYLLHGKDPEKVIRSCKDLYKFLYYAKIKNGGQMYHGDKHIGTIARWYVGKSGDQLQRKDKDDSFTGIENGSNAVLAMDLSDLWLTGFPPDLDLEHYVRAAWDLIATTEL